VTPERAAGILASVTPRLRGVGVFVDESAAHVLNTRDVAGFDVAQLHGSEPPDLCASLRGEGLEVWKALRPRDAEDLASKLDLYARVVDAILVEGFSSEAAGGTGTRFPIEWLSPVRERFSAPGADPGPDPLFVLAGGLDPDNVSEAIRRTRPTIVDVSSGVESVPGEKDPELIRRFLRAARSI
jgi:phosphoribosylanthranilate isomerase